MVSGGVPTTAVPDMPAIGRTAAQLTDWQTISYFFMVIVIIQIIAREWTASSIRRERKDMIGERERMWQVSEKFGDAADRLGEEMGKVVTELAVQRVLNARLEAVVSHLESGLKPSSSDKP